ncbi:MAG: DNA polymerase III subunit delta, partial [Pyrinomonadaceae bacterium]
VLTRDNLREKLRNREVAPVYVLFGAETFLRDKAAKYIADLCFSDGDMRDFNETEFSLDVSDNIRSAISAAEQLPMMAAKRVVRITDIRVSTSATKDTLKEDSEQIVANYLKDPSPATVVIFVADELNGSRKLTKLLTVNTVAVDFKRLENDDLRAWAKDHIRDLGSEADEQTIRYLVNVAGDDVRRLNNEIEKLSAAALPGKRITKELIDQLVPTSREISNFGLTDNLVAGRKAEAVRVLQKILGDGAEPLALLGLISSNYRRLLIAKELFASGASRSEVISVSKAYGPGQDAFLSLARRVEIGKLAGALNRIAQTDLAIKTSIGGSGPAGSRLQLEMLVCELALL